MAGTVKCAGCGAETVGAEDQAQWCDPCTRRYPEALRKAHNDASDYALKLRSGELIRFAQARIHGDFVTLVPDGEDGFHTTGMGGAGDEASGLPYPFPRGIDVRVADIVWCADAPEGS